MRVFDVNHMNFQGIINNIPAVAWFKDVNFQYVACNARFNELVQINNDKQILLKEDYDLPWEKYGDLYRQGDISALNGESNTFLHSAKLFNGHEVLLLSRKSPFYDDKKTIIGVSGLVTVVTSPEVIKKFMDINIQSYELGAIQKNQPMQYTILAEPSTYDFTSREFDCVFHLIRGKTSKEIARLLGISFRTVEWYIASIKDKMNCKSKSELISKAIECGFVQYIPKHFLINQTIE